MDIRTCVCKANCVALAYRILHIVYMGLSGPPANQPASQPANQPASQPTSQPSA